MKFDLPPWLKRAKDTPREIAESTALVKYKPIVDLTDAEEANGWTPETLAAYHAERHDNAMTVIAENMDRMRRPPRPRWANNKYSPLRWRG